MLVNEVLEMVIAGKRLSPKRKRGYKNAFDSLEKFNKEFPISGIQVNAWINSMPEYYSDETVLTYWKAVLAACRFIQRSSGRDENGKFRMFNVNPVEDSDMPRVKKKQRRYLKLEAVLKVMEQGRGQDDLVIVSVIVSSACRIGDLEGLKGEDIGDDSFKSPRGKTGELIYRCDSRLCEQMKRMAGDMNGYVFKSHSSFDKPMKRDVMARKIRKMMVKSGLTGSKLGPHTLRHSVGTMIAIKTGSGIAVAQQLNQENLKTAQIYIHDAEKMTSKNVNTLEMVRVRPVGQTALVPIIEDSIVETTDLLEEMFDRIPADVYVRPALKNRDLELIRRLGISFARAYPGQDDVYKCQELLKRVLRRT